MNYENLLREMRSLAEHVSYPITNLANASALLFEEMDRYFREFLQGLSPEEEKAECLLPVLVDRLITTGQMTVSVLHTDAVWFGVTYQEDRPVVEQALKSLHDQGVYPPSLKE